MRFYRYICMILSMVCLHSHANAADSFTVYIKGYDDGEKTTTQADYQQAVLFAKREAAERAGVKIKSLTSTQDFILQSDYIESSAEAVLLPDYKIIDIGYQIDGSYLVVLVGQVKQSNQPSTAQLKQALQQLADNPNQYTYDLGLLIGKHKIEKAYFVNDDKFVIHHSFKNGIITLTNINQGLMLLTGSYTTSADSGTVSIDFNQDGSADGTWRNMLTSGQLKIIRK